ncbi:CobW GTPase involved in cobalt insertion for B12 biosynthesis [Caenispirillum salinarum AK4]|uniref:CobW GTPase involved in cobalt insertion for B12 biosynthesis n=1 Tax=Caenispirillum salinarum AK4 TaxID=1238182 RepID=K9H2S9_9PROT|nr:cobalamin biosynthesis protein CobW [Caenispirillum salinarum]EKV32560.1 CobW GTPase involved in cobalt insertion for B12 biosynthesis [Caenispirillum salinarum AK4]
MSAARKIPATVITGFLGAGKTTLIRHLMENAQGKRIALVINEFGDLGMDREILSGCGVPGCEDENIVELANGCICCTVADEFLPTMEKLVLADNPPDAIVIETSGLALPKPLVKAFQWPEIRSRVTVDGVVTLVDAHAVAAGRFADDPDAVQKLREADEALDHDNPLEEVFEDQLSCADLVILNKADLLDEAGMDVLEQDLRARLRPGVKLVPAAYGKVDPAVLLGLDAGAEDDLDTRPSHHDDADGDHDHDDFDTFVVEFGAVEDLEALEARLAAAVEDHDILRIKGFLDIPGKPARMLVQGVGPRLDRWFDRPWKAGEERKSHLVVIGLHGIDRAAVAREIREGRTAAEAQAAPLSGSAGAA